MPGIFCVIKEAYKINRIKFKQAERYGKSVPKNILVKEASGLLAKTVLSAKQIFD
ncbi:MAG: hypothetical protein V5804_06990 [Mucilaginibacter sp.]|uniref:hypothetical protein n=1 Tax=Mucilaginibacter sp. TaxID=1882438 RepID=UPI0034E5834D